jgi:calcium-dependent protein kinase
MILDEVLQSIARDFPAMEDNATTSFTSRVVSSTYSHQEDTADCYTMPVATHVSPCTSEELDSPAAAISITGSETEDKYFIDPRVLGTGHHGTVRECIDRATGQRYAVKSIRKSDPSVKPGGLVREMMLLQEMKHPNIIQLTDVFEDAEYVHIVTDLCKGGELFDKIVERSSSDNGVPCFTEDEAARILHQVLTAVSYMHKHGIVHRDIKPENILFDTVGDVSSIKVIDFGLARKHFGGHGDPHMSTILGTPYYIAPEVLRKKYDKSCDLWSTGVISYILLCGSPPFNGINNDETHRSILLGQYCFPSQEWKGTSREARDFVRQLLQMDPSKRMTAEQALNHPWMVRHVNTDAVLMEEEQRQDRSSDEAIIKELRIPRRGSMLCGHLTRRKMRISMFGT